MPTETATKEPCFLRSERSPAFARYCERVYGRMLNQYGTADMEQLELLIQLLQLKPGCAALDVGCGTGMTTAYLAGRTGATFTGLDTNEVAIRRGRERAQTNEGLAFEVGSMDALPFAPGSFDAVVAIESLYFTKDLPGAVGQFKSVLGPGGRMALFFTHFGEPGTPVDPAETKLGQALVANDLHFTAHDLTASDRVFWIRSKEVAEDMAAEFEAEDNSDLRHLGETVAVLDLIGKGGHARYLYHVRAKI